MDWKETQFKAPSCLGCPVEIRIYNPHEKKLDSRTTSGFFIGYPDKSKGYRFYCPSHTTRIVETGNAKFIENDNISGSDEPRKVELKEVTVQDSPITSSQFVVPVRQITLPGVTQIVHPATNEQSNDLPEQQINDQPLHDEVISEPTNDIPTEVALRRSQRQRRSAISDDYMVYLQESDFDIGIDKDPVSFSQAINSPNSSKWVEAMKDELKSMNIMKYGILLICLKVVSQLAVNGFLRPNTTQMAISNGTRPDLLPKVLLRKMVLISMKHFHLFQRKIHLE